MRDLIAASQSPLVPKSKHKGGVLVAVDPYGQETQLSLRDYSVDVHIEDGFARTTIDQTYFNHNHWRMEGTFYFPIPAGAMSISTSMRRANHAPNGLPTSLARSSITAKPIPNSNANNL